MTFHAPIRAGSRGFTRQHPLTDEEIFRQAPSIFAVDKHDSRSERYTYIPTSRVLDRLRAEGWQPFAVQQGRTRVPGKADFTKHLIRLRREGTFDRGDDLFEAVLLNSHDGTSAYRILGGVWRVLCANGMIVGKDVIADVRVPHKGDIVGDVIEGTFTVVNEAERLMGQVEEMKSIKLKPHEVRALATGALLTRYDNVQDAGFSPQLLTAPKRTGDVGDDLWTTFNVVQENTLRGGQRRTNRVDADGKKIRDSNAKPITAIDQNTKINRALWTMADMLRTNRD